MSHPDPNRPIFESYLDTIADFWQRAEYLQAVNDLKQPQETDGGDA